jgi:soluble lytic murein transglycosylase
LLTRLEAQPSYPKLLSAPIIGEVAFMRAYTLEQLGRLEEAARRYLATPDERDNYFGQRATLRLKAMLATDDGRRVVEPLARSFRDQTRVAFQAGRFSEAKNAATQALRLITDASAKRELIETLRACYSRLPAYNITSRYRLIPAARQALSPSQKPSSDTSHTSLAAELIFLGLYDEGATELRLGDFNVAQQNGDAAYSLAVYSNRANQAWHAIRWAEPMAKTIPQDFRLELLPRDLAEMIYPAPYRDALLRYAKKNAIDARLILAIARQESRFNPVVKSQAAARGLVQFINETALKLADDEGLKDFQLDDVYDPEIAIRLAARNVANLFKQFPDNPYAVAAAYNTYESNVERWIFRSRSNDIDRFTAEVAIPETKDYVAKVMNNYRAYQQLYTKDLLPQR